MASPTAPLHGIARLAVTGLTHGQPSGAAVITAGFFTAADNPANQAAAFAACTRFSIAHSPQNGTGPVTRVWARHVPMPIVEAVGANPYVALHVWTYNDNPEGGGAPFLVWFMPCMRVAGAAGPNPLLPENTGGDFNGQAVQVAAYALPYAHQLPAEEQPTWQPGEQLVVYPATVLPQATAHRDDTFLFGGLGSA